jgi:hypothetical protein
VIATFAQHTQQQTALGGQPAAASLEDVGYAFSIGHHKPRLLQVIFNFIIMDITQA